MSNQIFPSTVRGLGFSVLRAPEDAVIVQASPAFPTTRVVQSQNPIWHWNLLYDFLIDNPLKPTGKQTYTDLQTLLGFITARRNSYDEFLFLDPDDNFVGPGVITQGWLPNFPFAFGAIIVVAGNAWQVSIAPQGARSSLSQPAFSSSPQTDGGLTWVLLGTAPVAGWPNPQAQLQLVTDGTNFYSPLQLLRGGQFYEDITDLSGGLTVYANGVATTGYTLTPGPLSFSGFSSAGLYLNWGTVSPTAPITATFNYLYRVRFEDSSQDFEKWANQWWTVGGENGTKGKGEIKLITARLPSSASYTPMPPIPFPVGATQMIMLYPTTLVLNQGTGTASGTAGPNAYCRLLMSVVGLGQVSPSAIFGGWNLPPSIPPSSVKAVYAYTTDFLVTQQAPQPLAFGGVNWPPGMVQNFPFFGTPVETGLTVSGAAAQTFPFNQTTFTMYLGASVPAHYTPPMGRVYAPRMIVFY